MKQSCIFVPNFDLDTMSLSLTNVKFCQSPGLHKKFPLGCHSEKLEPLVTFSGNLPNPFFSGQKVCFYHITLYTKDTELALISIDRLTHLHVHGTVL